MNRTLVVVFTVLACVAGPASIWSAPLQKKVLIIGVDGTMSQYLAVARTPNLNALKAGGIFTDRAINSPVTHSAACWASMFTGAWGDKTLITDPGNALTPNRFDIYPNFMKRLEMVNSNWNTVCYLRWCPLQDALAGTDVITCYGSDAAITTATCNLLTNSNPDVFFTILLDVDSAGHSPGWGTSAYITAIETADTRVGQMMNALTNRVTYTNEDWLVMILADHGQHDSTPERSRYTFHLVWGAAAARGTFAPIPSLVDVCATVLTHMGVAVDPAWNLDARIEGMPLPPMRFGTNLLYNGDAEFNSGTNDCRPDRGIAWWWDYTGVSLGQYGASTNLPSIASPGPTNRGNNCFVGGSNATAFISQTLNVSEFAGNIDGPGAEYELSGWLGGAGTRSNSIQFAARFLNASNVLLGSNYIGPVSTTTRGGVTCLLPCATNGLVPAGTRWVEVILSTTAARGANMISTNYACADNLSLVFTPRLGLNVQIVGYGRVDPTPNQSSYTNGEEVLLNAVPANGDFVFTGWADGSTDNPRRVVIGATNDYTAIFGAYLRIAVQGEGLVLASPAKGIYTNGETVALTAVPTNCLAAFIDWTDGNLANPRNITIGASNYYEAILGIVPGYAGRPVISVNGQTNQAIRATNEANFCMWASLSGSSIRYTLDGSAPGPTSARYSNCFTLAYTGQAPDQQTITVRAVTFDPLGIASPEACPVTVSLVPSPMNRPPFLELRRSSTAYEAPANHLWITGDIGQNYSIETATEIYGDSVTNANWVAIGTVSNALGQVLFIDNISTNATTRLYRVRFF